MVKWLMLLCLVGGMVLEIWALLTIGGRLGLAWTLIWMGASCVLGLLMIRWAGLRTLMRIHHKLREEILPTAELMDMGMILAGGLFLVLPGFVSDAAGALLLLPPVRWVLRSLICLAYGNMLPPAYPAGPYARPREEVVEIQAEDLT